MKELSIDIETFSSVDLRKSGVYRYAEAPDFQILLFAYSYGGKVEIVDFANDEVLPDQVLADLVNPDVLKTAFNAAFERTCIAAYLGLQMPASQWRCTMVKAMQLGLPGSLDSVAKALKLSAEKDNAGKALIKYFSVPCKPTKTNGLRIRNLPAHDLVKWEAFKNYCIQDVVVEKQIRESLSWFEPVPTEHKVWNLDQKINDTGIMLNAELVNNAIAFDLAFAEKLSTEAAVLTGLSNPNSVAQLKQWILDTSGEEVDKLNKDTLPELIDKTDDEVLRRVLELRQQMAKTSVKKYLAMRNAICRNGRVHGVTQYYGAGRTGRWAGRLVQVQNLPKNDLSDLDLARRITLSGDIDTLELCFGNVPDTLSQLIRTAFVAPAGNRLIPSDFSAIEARVIAWLAGENWRLEVFKTHGKIYEASAAQMFGVPIESIKKGSDLRQKGKVSELALGYQGGPNALVKMGALKMGLQEEELPKLVKMWRNANKKIVAFWDSVNRAAITAVETGRTVSLQHQVGFQVYKDILFIHLPSGRKLAYQQPRLLDGKYGPIVTYSGTDQQKKTWGRQETYGGKLVENIVQAVSRDLLADAMLRLDAAGYKICMHVHDEVVLEVPTDKGSLDEIDAIMGASVPWASGLPLKADSYETLYYKKD